MFQKGSDPHGRSVGLSVTRHRHYPEPGSKRGNGEGEIYNEQMEANQFKVCSTDRFQSPQKGLGVGGGGGGGSLARYNVA